MKCPKYSFKAKIIDILHTIFTVVYSLPAYLLHSLDLLCHCPCVLSLQHKHKTFLNNYRVIYLAVHEVMHIPISDPSKNQYSRFIAKFRKCAQKLTEYVRCLNN